MRNVMKQRYTWLGGFVGLALLLVASSVMAATTGDWQIRVREAAVVRGDRVLLGEIAEPVGTYHPKTWKTLASTPLWASPSKPGRPMSVSRSKLRKVMRKYLGDGAALAVYPSSIVIQRGGKVVDREALHKMVVETLTPHFSRMEGEAKLRDIKLPRFLFLRSPRNRVYFKPPKELIAGRIPLYFIEISPANKVIRRTAAGAILDLWVTVPCAGNPINRHDVVTPENITYAKKNLAYLRGDVWDGKGGPWRSLRSIGGGNVVYQTDLERLPMVIKGSKVSLVFKGKSLQLTTMVEALADGKPGDSIPVRNLQSRRQVYAKVRDADTVVVSR